MNRPGFFRRKWVRVAVSLLVTVASVWVMARLVLVSKDQLKNIPTSFQVFPLLLTFPLFIVSALLTSFIWGQMMAVFDKKISLRQHIVIYLATLFAGRLPGGIWNVVGRIAWYEQLGIRKRITTFVSILQWLVIIWSGTIILLIAILWIVGLNVKTLIVLAGAILLIVIFLNPRFMRWLLGKLLKDAEPPEINIRRIFGWLAFYLFIWVLGGTILYLVSTAFYPGASTWLYGLAAWSAARVSGTLVTFLPSGLGVVELVSSLVLTAQLPSSISVVVSLVLRVLLTGYELLCSLVFLVIARIRYTTRFPRD